MRLPLCCCLLAAPLLAQSIAEAPYDTDPVLHELMDWVTFQITFDRDTVHPEMAAGEVDTKIEGTPAFADGIKGRALIAGQGSAQITYPRGANAPLARRGAVMLWIKPLDWTHENAPYGTFLRLTNGAFYLQRQGPQKNDEGRFTRHEGLQLIVKDGDQLQNAMRSTSEWPNGDWHLLVGNWAWPSLTFSIDGSEFIAKTIDGEFEDAQFGDLILGSTGGERTLLDELTIFRRPLSLPEIRRIQQVFQEIAR